VNAGGLDRRRIEAVLFDVDGTLADTHQAIALRLAQALQPLAGLFPRRDPRPVIRRLLLATETPVNNLYALADRLGLDQAAGPILDVLHWWRGEGRPSRYLLIPGVETTLDRLRADYRLGIVSARDARGVDAFLRQFELTGAFDCIITARTCRRTKPHPAPVQRAAELLGLPPQACLMVGDTVVDILAGKRAGAQAVGVLCGFGERDELASAGADLILQSTADLPSALLV
jgi:phosphoglycolate phosphatase-like HAD superfamily hydrolase